MQGHPTRRQTGTTSATSTNRARRVQAASPQASTSRPTVDRYLVPWVVHRRVSPLVLRRQGDGGQSVTTSFLAETPRMCMSSAGCTWSSPVPTTWASGADLVVLEGAAPDGRGADAACAGLHLQCCGGAQHTAEQATRCRVGAPGSPSNLRRAVGGGQAVAGLGAPRACGSSCCQACRRASRLVGEG